MRADLAVFGYVGSGLGKETRALFADFAERLGRAVTLEVSVFEATSYADLSRAIRTGYADLAWLPPLPLMALDGVSEVRPLVAHLRSDGFHSALVVAAGSRFLVPSDLEGARAAWVDRDSASGYVLARMALAQAGIDPVRAFVEERFFGSHEAVARAIARGVSDVGATYAGFDAHGELTRAPWFALGPTEAARVRVLSRAGEIPGDATVSRAGLPDETRARFADALVAMSTKPKNRVLLARLFGIVRFVPWQPASYEDFRRRVDAARRAGVLGPAGDVGSNRS